MPVYLKFSRKSGAMVKAVNTVNSVNTVNIANIVDFNAMRFKKKYNCYDNAKGLFNSRFHFK